MVAEHFKHAQNTGQRFIHVRTSTRNTVYNYKTVNFEIPVCVLQ